MKTKITDYTKEQRKQLRVVRSHKLAGGLYNVCYVIRNFENSTVTTMQISIIENVGGVKASLLHHLH